jgi:hypothetical protein
VPSTAQRPGWAPSQRFSGWAGGEGRWGNEKAGDGADLSASLSGLKGRCGRSLLNGVGQAGETDAHADEDAHEVVNRSHYSFHLMSPAPAAACVRGGRLCCVSSMTHRQMKQRWVCSLPSASYLRPQSEQVYDVSVILAGSPSTGMGAWADRATWPLTTCTRAEARQPSKSQATNGTKAAHTPTRPRAIPAAVT